LPRIIFFKVSCAELSELQYKLFLQKHQPKKRLLKDTYVLKSLDTKNQEAFYRGNVNGADVLRGVPACFQAMSFILNLKRSTMLDLELYYDEKELEKVLC
jgi:hypothetical protein